MERNNLIIGILLSALAAASWWLTRDGVGNREEAETPAHTPDYYIENLTGITMDEEGKPIRQLTAELMTHYPDDDTTELILPRITAYDGDRPPWRVRSEKGWISGDGEVILLQGKVHIDRSAAIGVRPVHAVTYDLRVQPMTTMQRATPIPMWSVSRIHLTQRVYRSGSVSRYA